MAHVGNLGAYFGDNFILSLIIYRWVIYIFKDNYMLFY
jgi:hypothetical protein